METSITNAAFGLLFLIGGVGFLAGISIGYLIRKKIAEMQAGTLENKLSMLIEQSKTEAKEILLKAKEESVKILEEAKREEKEREAQLSKQEQRLSHREDLVDKKFLEFERIGKELEQKAEKLKITEAEAGKMKERQLAELEKVAGMDKEKANELLASVIQRYTNSQVSEISTTVVNITSDDIKGKIIGKEGRNIRALERITGVEILIDDTPGAIIISCFDPIRRQVAKLALDKLIADGRIQPARIEEAVEKAHEEINNKIKEAGENAVYEAGLVGIDPRLVNLLGRLHYRTSYGQNVLMHSLEAVHIGAMLAEELGGDVHVSKMGALFHDIGKAVDHEVQGTHVEIGRKILQKFGIDEKVILAMQS